MIRVVGPIMALPNVTAAHDPTHKTSGRQVIKRQPRRITELETQVADPAAQLAQQDAVIARLQQQVADLSAQVARLLKNSSTSSKPPSSDIVKPPKAPGPNGGKRHISGRPGHWRHQWEPFAPEQIERVEKHILQECPDCGGTVSPAAGLRLGPMRLKLRL